MEVFTAEEFNKHPRKVYRSADLSGEVKINHDRYPDRVFVLTAKERKPFDDIPPDLSDKFKPGDTVMIGDQKFLVGDKVSGDPLPNLLSEAQDLMNQKPIPTQGRMVGGECSDEE